MTPIDILILLLAVAVVGGSVGWAVYRRRNGKGGCGSCGNCPYAGQYEKKPPKTK